MRNDIAQTRYCTNKCTDDIAQTRHCTSTPTQNQSKIFEWQQKINFAEKFPLNTKSLKRLPDFTTSTKKKKTKEYLAQPRFNRHF